MNTDPTGSGSKSLFGNIYSCCRYFHVPAGNLPKDTTLFGADLFYARYLRKQNFVLWASDSDTPDFGGKVTVYISIPGILFRIIPTVQYQQITFLVEILSAGPSSVIL